MPIENHIGIDLKKVVTGSLQRTLIQSAMEREDIPDDDDLIRHLCLPFDALEGALRIRLPDGQEHD